MYSLVVGKLLTLFVAESFDLVIEFSDDIPKLLPLITVMEIRRSDGTTAARWERETGTWSTRVAADLPEASLFNRMSAF